MSYHASAETGCHLALGWAIPETILDLEAEFRCETTNYPVEGGKNLPGAMREYGLSWSDVIEKPAMIKLILRGEPYTAEERRQIIDYCWLDTDGLAALLPRILPDILARPHGWAFALLRGYYSGHCIARDGARRASRSTSRPIIGWIGIGMPSAPAWSPSTTRNSGCTTASGS